MKTNPEAIDLAERLIEENIQYRYDIWRRARAMPGGEGLREPNLYLSYFAGLLQSSGVASFCPYLPSEAGRRFYTRWHYTVATLALGRLRRSGKVVTSLGIGESGREVRCYEPA